MSKTAQQLTKAVAYIRKSTKGISKGKERQEKSLAQQKAEILKLAEGRFKIVASFEDDGKSGWRRGHKRPGFARMLSEVSEHGAQAILCDHIDRFSRAAFDEVQEDVNALRKAGCRFIVTASHGEYDLGARFDIGAILKFVVAVWSANEFSRQLSRRISLARRNKAEKFERSGSQAPYGLKLEDKKLVKGDPKEIKIIRWIFTVFAQGWSLSAIAGNLNDRKIPPPSKRGSDLWLSKTIRLMLTRRAYIGDFEYGKEPSGKFYRLDEKGEVVEADDVKGQGKVYEQRDACKEAAIIDRALFEKCQRRLKAIGSTREGRKAMYALSGLLTCAHCDTKMTGVTTRGYTYYRCCDISRHGRSVKKLKDEGKDIKKGWGKDRCPQRCVREDWLLPRLIEKLKVEVEEIISHPPEEVTRPKKDEQDKKQLQKERDKLQKKIDLNIDEMFDEDVAVRQEVKKRITAMRAELKQLDAELAARGQGNESPSGWSPQQIDALSNWWNEFGAAATKLPMLGGNYEKYCKSLALQLLQAEECEQAAIKIDPKRVRQVINQKLQEGGVEVSLRWRTETKISRETGKPYHRYEIDERGILLEAGKSTIRRSSAC
jgi:DNA invertase Pin-like site-specific DNA recombinase